MDIKPSTNGPTSPRIRPGDIYVSPDGLNINRPDLVQLPNPRIPVFRTSKFSAAVAQYRNDTAPGVHLK